MIEACLLHKACSVPGSRPQLIQDGARSSQAAEPGSPCAPGAVRLDAQLCLGQGAAECCLGSCSSGRGRTSPGFGRRAPERGHPLVLGSGHRHAPRRDRERCAAGVLRQPPPRLGGRRWFKQEGGIRWQLQFFNMWLVCSQSIKSLMCHWRLKTNLLVGACALWASMIGGRQSDTQSFLLQCPLVVIWSDDGNRDVSACT